MTRTTAVVFDRDGVLLHFDQVRFARDVLTHIPIPREELGRRWLEWLGGRAVSDTAMEERTESAFLASLADSLDLDPASRSALLGVDYTTAIRAFADAPEALVEARRRGLRVGVLTNNSAGVSPTRMLEIAGLGGLVDVALTAQMVGARKPAEAAYRAAAAALDVPTEACLFFDDTRASVDGARAAGMSAWQVDRSRADHDIPVGVVRDLTALGTILRARCAD